MTVPPESVTALIERAERMTVASALAARATTDPERPFLLHATGPVGFATVDAQAESLAAALAGFGIEPGDRIALILPSCPEFVVTLFAAAKLGAQVVPLNPRLAVSELQYLLRHSESVCAVTIEQYGGLDYLQLFEEIMPQLPELQYLVTVGDEDLWYDDRIFQFEDLLSAGAGRDFASGPVQSDPEACFALLYTSGTSGKPKGVELSHANLLSAAAGTARGVELVPDDRLVGISALFHVYGLTAGLLSSVLAGSSIVLQDESDAPATLEAAASWAATVHFGIPTLFVRELGLLSQGAELPRALRLAVVAGAPVPDGLVLALSEQFGVPVVTGYSLTETASTVCSSVPGDPAVKRRFTVGRPLPGTHIRIADPESASGGDLPVESVGEIRVKGPGVMLGYYRQPRRTAEAFDDQGYFRTGDLGLVDEDGYLHLVGRTKDVIIRAGFVVYPRVLESRVEAHPAIQEAAAVGVPDELLGEAVCACVVPVEGAIVNAQEIVDWCRETLADELVPDSVRFVDSLPRTATGQVRRVELARSVKAEGRSA
jgi:fatty-acyl-CoA synthase